MRFFNAPKISFAFLLFVAIFILFILNIHSFLSGNNRLNGDILVFERWIYDLDNSVSEAIETFNDGGYKALVIVGTLPEKASITEDNKQYFDGARQAFIEKGFDEKLLHSIWIPNVQKHRTFSMALGFKMWAFESGMDIKSIDVFTFGVHAKKSELVFKQALEPEISVGVISASPAHYNPKFWWLTGIGWKWVYYDSLKYVHALL